MYIPQGAVPIDESTNAPAPYMPKGAVLIDQGQEEPSPQEGLLGKALDVIAPGLGTMGSILAQNPKTILPAAETLARSVPNAAANTFAGLASIGSPAFGNILGSLAQQVPTPSPQASQGLQLAANTALAAPGLEAIPELGALGGAGLKAIGSKLADLTGYNADSKATDFVRGLIGNQQEIKKAFRQSYGNLQDTASQRGYNLLPNTTQKPIEKPLFAQTIGGLSPKIRDSFIENMPADYSKSWDAFRNKPSYENAHDFQSNLGKYGVDLLKDRDTAMTGRAVLDARNALNQDIMNTFNKYGDNDLAQMKSDISNQYRENENRLLLADKLKTGIRNFPDERGLTGLPKPIVNAYAKAGFKKIIGRYEPTIKTEATDASIRDIMQSLQRKEISDRLMRLARTGGIGLAGGALGAAGYHVAKELF